MTAPAGGGCPSEAGPICPDSTAAESPEGAQSRPNVALWAISDPGRSGRPKPTAGPSHGHWEGDLVIGRKNRTAVATPVERTSRHTLVAPLPSGYDAKNTARAVTEALARQPPEMVKTLTWDQGREMARWADIEKNLGIEVYFCEPRSPWQQPANEQTNGLLRRWLPKSTDLNIGAVRLRRHRRQPQHHAPTHPQLELSPNRPTLPISCNHR